MGHWTGNGVIDFILNVILIVLVVVLAVWAIKEIAPIFTSQILLQGVRS
jgi:hypothetical protein